MNTFCHYVAYSLCAFQQAMLWDSRHSHNNINNMIACIPRMSSGKEAAWGLPELGVRFLVDSNSWIVNGTSNLRIVRQMLRVLSQLASNSVLYSPAYFFSWLLRNKFLVPKFLFSSLWQHGRGKYNVPTEQKSLWILFAALTFIWQIGERMGKIAFTAPENGLLLHVCLNAFRTVA